MGPIYSYFYMLRPMFWAYITWRLGRTTWGMVKRHWRGEDDQHYFWYYDTLYPDLLHDANDMRYLNFRYTDAKVTPEPMTGYFPHDDVRYGSWLNKKKDSLLQNRATIAKEFKRDE